MLKDLLIDTFYVDRKPKPAKKRVHFYQYDGEQKQEFEKERGCWYYNAPKNVGGSIGCDTLAGAKLDVTTIYKGKVWIEIV